MYSCDGKAEFSAAITQSLVEIILIYGRKTFPFIINVENSCAA